jgi:hypothetical protein
MEDRIENITKIEIEYITKKREMERELERERFE